MIDKQTKTLIRALLYPILFSAGPEQSDAERAIAFVIDRRAMQRSEEQYSDAIRRALADSEEDLSPLADKRHTDATLRRFLNLVLETLQKRGSSR